VVVGGSVPADHDGWMWDLTVPGNNDHDFYVEAAQSSESGHAYTSENAIATSVLVHNAGGDCAPGTTSLFRVSPEERGTSELDNGLHPANFPRTDELDGAAHFGNEARVNDFAATHPESHWVGFRTEVPSSWLSSPGIEIWEGMTENQLEFVIPREMFEELNQFPRFPWSPGR